MKYILEKLIFNKINESKGQAKSQYLATGKITPEEFNTWCQMGDQLYGYMPYAIKWWLKMDKELAISEIQDVLYKFYEAKETNKLEANEKDINKYTWDELVKKTDEVSKIVSKNQEKKQLKLEGADKLIDNDDVLLLRINTVEGSAQYGYGAKWCITMKDGNHWTSYHKTELITFYFLVQKNLEEFKSDGYGSGDSGTGDPLYKLAFVVYPNGQKIEVFNCLDNRINQSQINDIYEKYPYIKDQLQPREFNDLDYVKGDYEINEDQTVSITKGNFEYKGKDYKLKVKFKYCQGDFVCTGATHAGFANLENFPDEVKGKFDISSNILENLIGCPEIIGGDLDASNNGMSSIEGISQNIGKNIRLGNNNLKTLEGLQEVVNGNLTVWENELINLKGVPRIIKGNFNCSGNKADGHFIEDITWLPEEVHGDFDIKYNGITDEMAEEIKRRCKIKGELKY